MTRPRSRWVAAAVAGLLATTGLLAAPAAAAPGAEAPGREVASEHQRIVDFWTPTRVAQAVPRDFVVDPATGRVSLAKPVAPSGTTTGGGALWEGSGLVQTTTGKVLFAMGRSYYVCSASVVTDSTDGRSVVLTAGHCAYDETRKRFATNWMFVPDYDATPTAGLDAGGSFCASTTYGCWTAQALVVSTGYATSGRFNTQAILNDFAFAVMRPGGKGGTVPAELDQAVGSQPVAFSGTTPMSASLFGYPAGSPYDGKQLVSCQGSVGTDARLSGRTYGVACDMTGGSSGGPWFSPFSEGSGTQMSVNSYGYTGEKVMYGPKLNDLTARMFTMAQSATTNSLVS
jgi:V8-like Glu-specific endopeptidase